jgi:hypothetical protein
MVELKNMVAPYQINMRRTANEDGEGAEAIVFTGSLHGNIAPILLQLDPGTVAIFLCHNGAGVMLASGFRDNPLLKN